MNHLVKYKGILSLLIYIPLLAQPLAGMTSHHPSGFSPDSTPVFVVPYYSENEEGILTDVNSAKKMKYTQPLTFQRFEDSNSVCFPDIKRIQSYPIQSTGIHPPFIVYKISLSQHTADD